MGDDIGRQADLTVIIPTKNRPERLERAISSALSQTRAVQVLVVDDGSEPPAVSPNILASGSTG